MLIVAKQHPEITIPKRFFSKIVQVMNQLFTNIEKEGSKSLEAEEKIIGNIFEIAQNIAITQNSIGELINSELSEHIFNTILINISQQ